MAQVAADLLWAPPPKQELGDHGAEVLVGLDPAPMMTCSAHGGAALSVEGAIPAAAHRVALELTRNRRRRPAESHGDCPQAQPRLSQIGDLDAFVLRQVARADLSDREAIQRRHEPDYHTVAVHVVTARPVRPRGPRDTHFAGRGAHTPPASP